MSANTTSCEFLAALRTEVVDRFLDVEHVSRAAVIRFAQFVKDFIDVRTWYHLRRWINLFLGAEINEFLGAFDAANCRRCEVSSVEHDLRGRDLMGCAVDTQDAQRTCSR